MYDDDLPEIPMNVLQQIHGESDYLVRFYDKSDLWWVLLRSCVERVDFTTNPGLGYTQTC